MTQVTSQRAFLPGTSGWTIDDLYDDDIQWQWSQGRYEILDGVLTKMAPQGFEGIDPQSSLRRFLDRHLDATKQAGNFYHEVDLLLRPSRIPRPDMIFLSAEQHARQKKIQREKKLKPGRYHPVYVAPHFILESVSLGHEGHDRIRKRGWYAEAEIPHYWILTSYERSLVCLILQRDKYVEESRGRDSDILHSSAFGGVSIPLAELWDTD